MIRRWLVRLWRWLGEEPVDQPDYPFDFVRVELAAENEEAVS